MSERAVVEFAMRNLFCLLVLASSAGAEPPTAPVAATWELPAAAGKATAFAWLPDRTAIVAGDAAGTLRVYHLVSGREVAARSVATSAILDLDTNRDGTLVVAASREGVAIWNRTADTVRTVASSKLFPDESIVDSREAGTATAVAFVEARTVAVLSTRSSLVRIGTDGVLAGKATAMPEAFGRGVTALYRDEAAAAPRAGLGLAYYEGDEIDELRVWDYAKGAVAARAALKELTRPAALAISPDGRRAIVRDRHRANKADLLLVDVRSLKEVGAIPLGKLKPNATPRVAFSRDGRLLFLAVPGAPATVVDAARGAPLARLLTDAAPAVSFSPDGRRIAIGRADARVAFHDLRAAIDPNPPKTFDPIVCWNDLVAVDGATAQRAAYRLADRPDETLKLFRERMKPAVKPTETELAKWFAALGAPAFGERQAAMKKLTAVADTIVPELQAELERNASPEVAKAIQALIEASDRARRKLEGDVLRGYRTVQVLEAIGAPARPMLAAWAAGATGHPLTDEARRAVERLDRHPNGK